MFLAKIRRLLVLHAQSWDLGMKVKMEAVKVAMSSKESQTNDMAHFRAELSRTLLAGGGHQL
jgi:hypothetical protein